MVDQLIDILEITAQTGNATSASSHNVTTGSKTFVISGTLDTAIDEAITIKRVSAPATTLYGTVTAISGTSYTVNITSVAGSGSSITDWLLIGTKTLRVASPPLAYNPASAPAVYLPNLVQAALLSRHIVARGRTLGGSEISYGEAVVDNTTGELDDWLTYGYGSRGRALLGAKNTAYGSLTTVIDGRVEQPSNSSRTELRFRFKDRQIELEQPAQPSVYGGTNSGATGIDGTPNDLKGQPKIRIFGKVKNIDPDHVNTSTQIFAINHTALGASAAVASIDAVRNNGVAWTFGTDRANLAALQAASPAQGVYDTCLALGLFKLGGTIGQGAITCDATERSTASENHAASIINRVLLDAGVDSGDIVSANITALETAAPYNCGVLVRGDSYRDVIDVIAQSVHAWVTPNRLGQYNVRQITAPSGTPSAVFRPFIYGNKAESTDYEVREVERLVSNDAGRGVPAWKITINYQRMWVVQDKDALAASVTEANKEKFSRQYRSVTASDETIKYQFPEAIEIVVDVALIDEADAQDLADLLLTLYGVRRDLFRVVATYDADIVSANDLGDVIELHYDRFGLNAGVLYNIHGIQYNARERVMDLEIWG